MKKILTTSLFLLLSTTTTATDPVLTWLDISSIMTISPFLSTSADQDSKVEEIKSEAATILSQVEMDEEVVISQDLRKIIEEIRKENADFAKTTDLEILELIITQ